MDRVDDMIPDTVIGVDFSGAKHAGRKIWLARGRVVSGNLAIESCTRASDLPGSGVEREQCLTALVRHIAQQHDCVIGLDFPFGLPKVLVQQSSWSEFVLAFHTLHSDPKAFRQKYRQISGGKEIKRETDRATQTPFCAYNLRLFRQTYYGIGDVLQPLAAADSVRVLPMQAPAEGRPWLIEVCPASTLKGLNLYRPYKGASELHIRNRGIILDWLEGHGSVTLAAAARSSCINDAEGDALDSIVGAFAACRALPQLPQDVCDGDERIEGRVYC